MNLRTMFLSAAAAFAAGGCARSEALPRSDFTPLIATTARLESVSVDSAGMELAVRVIDTNSAAVQREMGPDSSLMITLADFSTGAEDISGNRARLTRLPQGTDAKKTLLIVSEADRFKIQGDVPYRALRHFGNTRWASFATFGLQ